MGVATLTVDVSAGLKDAVGAAADAAGVKMNAFVAEVLAREVGRPELAQIPRKPAGRPRKALAKKR